MNLQRQIIGLISNFKQRKIVFLCGNHKFVHRGLPNTPSGVINYSPQAFFILRIDNQTKVSEHIFDFFSLIERKTAIHSVWNISLSQRILHRSRLCIGSIQNGKRSIRQLQIHCLLKNGLRYISTLIPIWWTAMDYNLFTLFVGSPHGFIEFVLVVVDHTVSCFNDILCWAVVLLKSISFCIRVILVKIQYVFNVGATKRIDTLRIVTYHA